MPKIFAKSSLPNVMDFCARFGDQAVAVQEKTGISAQAMMAQCAQETGWGDHVLRVYEETPEGPALVDSRNLFNIKISSNWTGRAGYRKVLEYDKNKKPYYTQAWFKVYDSYEDSFADYAALVQNTPRYKAAWDARQDPKVYVTLMQQCGYATDPRYANLIQQIMDRHVGIKDL